MSCQCLPWIRRRPAAASAPVDGAAWYSGVTRGRVARVLAETALRRVPVRVRYPDGRTVGAGDATAPVLEVVRPTHLFTRLETSPKIGLGEAYMAGDWRAAAGTDLADALMPFAAQLADILPRPVLALRGLADRALPAAHRNDLHGSRSNVAAHYDLSNELFATFLDPTMSYSSALFDEGAPFADQDLATAQNRKIDTALDAAGVGPGTRLLEIGTGWGQLAIRAAERGAIVTSVTLSAEQRQLAQSRVQQAGLADRVTINLQDYREVTGRFDAIVSIEMIEAVGEEFWPEYFATIDRLLAPDGAAVIQAILMDHDRLLTTRHSYGWIQKYIFPGGLIPSLRAIEEVTTRHTELTVSNRRPFGSHYAHTLRRWRTAFIAAAPQVEALGFDEPFRRMWEFYLAYSEAGFASGYLDVAQLTMRHRTP